MLKFNLTEARHITLSHDAEQPLDVQLHQNIIPRLTQEMPHHALHFQLYQLLVSMVWIKITCYYCLELV